METAQREVRRRLARDSDLRQYWCVRIALGLVAVIACGGSGDPPKATGAPASPVAPPITPAMTPSGTDAIPAETQRAGDAKRGWEALVGEGYVGCGVPRSLWRRFGFAASAQFKLDRSRGADLPYFMNTAKLPSGVEVVTANCLGCHAAFLRGKLVVGLGEASFDFTSDLSTELALAGMLVQGAEQAEMVKLVGRVRALAPHVRMRTVGANPADHIAAVLFAHRDPETLAWSEQPLMPLPADTPIPVDVPAWWLMKRKTAMFHTGAGRGDQARIMMTASVLCVDDVATARGVDAYFPDVRAFILSLEPPAYPGPIDAQLAATGKRTFDDSCAKCHGTYGAGGSYETRVIPLRKVGTDPLLADHAAQFAKPFTRWFNRSFYGEISRLEPGDGYVAPPLDGVWATAPYFHNGSVPNLAAVLDSTRRRARTVIVRGGEAYDLVEVGWPNTDAADRPSDAWVYDTSQPGYANTGHTFGDRLTAAERAAVLEYLKTL